MKRSISLMLAMIMVLSMLPTSIFAAGEAILTVGDASVNVGDSFVVPVSISSNPGITNFNITVTGIENGLTLTKVSAYPTDADELNMENGGICTNGLFESYMNKITWVRTPAISANKALFYLYFTATTAGTYSIGLEQTEGTASMLENNGVAVETTVNAGTITVTGGEGGEGGSTSENYEVVMNIPTPTVTEGSTFEVQITANKGFAAAEVCIQMIGATVNLAEVSSNCTAKMDWNTEDGEDGIPRVTLVAYGLDETSPATFILTFLTTDKNSTSTRTQPVVIESAAFGTGISAETANLTEVEGNLPSKNVLITPAQHAVTLPDIFTGYTTVAHGADYTFAPETATGAYYNYEKPTVTVGGRTVEVIENADGSWTVKNVTGELVITGNRTEKTYGITVNGEGTDASEKVSYTGTPTYNTDFTFTIPADKAAGLEPGYTYALTSVTIGGASYSFSTNGKNCTIPGSAITGDVVITVTKTVLEVNKFTVTADGSGNGDATITNATVGKNENAVMTLTTDPLYTYDVKATMAGQNVNVDISDNTYTVANVTGNVIFTVTKTLNVTSAKVDKYVQLDGSRMWLVTINGNGATQISGKTYTYNGKQMSWSEKYQAYAVLVVAANQDGEADKPDVTTGFELVTVDTIPAITYNMDVNMADDQNTVDAADAQLVWNMYSAKYSDFTDAVTIEKFFRADVNGDKQVDTNDALAIVNSILGITQ